MEITTKFNVGDAVWVLRRHLTAETKPCDLCRGAGQVPVVGLETLVNCPKCWGKGEGPTGDQYVLHEVSNRPMTVGQIRVSVEGPSNGCDRGSHYGVDVSNMGPRSYKREETYMMAETGVGSGTIYHAEDLCATRQEAEGVARARTLDSLDHVRFEEVS